MRRDYLIRYGLARAIGRFELTSGTLDRNQVVVIRSHRGTELGEVLAEAPLAGDDQAEAVPPPAPILRVALAEDFQRARDVELDRTAHFERCRAIFDEGTWPLELIDAEPLLDPGRTVLHYLGPHRLDASGLIAAFRDRCGLDVVLEPVGRDLGESDLAQEAEPEPEPEPAEAAHGCGSCGSSGGGCGTGGGCSASDGCAVKALVAGRRRQTVDA